MKDREFARRVRAGMALKGIKTATELARRLTISRQRASALMHGQETDSFALLTRMGALFGISSTWLRYGLGAPTPREPLTPNEARLLELYRRAAKPAKEQAFDTLTGAARRP